MQKPINPMTGWQRKEIPKRQNPHTCFFLRIRFKLQSAKNHDTKVGENSEVVKPMEETILVNHVARKNIANAAANLLL